MQPSANRLHPEVKMLVDIWWQTKAGEDRLWIRQKAQAVMDFVINQMLETKVIKVTKKEKELNKPEWKVDIHLISTSKLRKFYEQIVRLRWLSLFRRDEKKIQEEFERLCLRLEVLLAYDEGRERSSALHALRVLVHTAYEQVTSRWVNKSSSDQVWQEVIRFIDLMEAFIAYHRLIEGILDSSEVKEWKKKHYDTKETANKELDQFLANLKKKALPEIEPA